MQTAPLSLKSKPEKKTASHNDTANVSKSGSGKEVKGAPGFPLFLQQRIAGTASIPMQEKLIVGGPNNEYEREADAVADKIMKMPMVSGEGGGLTNELSPNQTQFAGSPFVQTKAATKAIHPIVSESVKNTVRSPGSGSPLNESVRSRVEPELGADLSNVRVFSDTSAHAASKSLDAKAFTHQNNIFLGKDYSTSDLHLLAHELTHVVQQRAVPSIGLQRELTSPAPAGQRVPASSAPAGQRESTSPTPAGRGRVQTPPVIWGIETERRRIYVSVRAPARTLAEIAQYVYGSTEMLGSLQSQNGIADSDEPLNPGRTLTLVEGSTLSDIALTELQAALDSGMLTRTEGIPSQSEPENTLYRFVANGQSLELTETQLRGVVTGLSVVLKRHVARLRSTAESTLDIQDEHVRESNSVVRGISDWWGDAELPSTLVHKIPIIYGRALETNLSELDTSDAVAASRNISSMAGRLRRLADLVDESTNAWRRYINATISGAEGVAAGLEITRDVSFGIAIGIGAVVAFPAVATAGAITSTVGTGIGGTLVAGGTVVAGGAGAGAVLRGGSSIAGTRLAGDRVDWDQVLTDTSEGARRGAVDAFVGLIAPGVSSGAARMSGAALTRVAGREAVEGAGRRLGASALGRFALRAGQHVPGAMAVGGVQSGLTEAAMGRIENAPRAMLHGAIMGALFAGGGAAAQPLLQRLGRLLPPSFSFRPRVKTYHGTRNLEGAANIRAGNARMTGGTTDDFGRAFYTSRNPAVAKYEGGRFAPEGTPVDVIEATVPMRWRDYLGIGRPGGDRAFLNLLKGRQAQRWEQMMLEPTIPGSSTTTRAESYFSGQAELGGMKIPVSEEFRYDLYENFLRREGLAAPGIVEGALPQSLEGATQMAITSQRVLDMINEAFRYNPKGLAQLIEGMLGSAGARALTPGPG